MAKKKSKNVDNLRKNNVQKTQQINLINSSEFSAMRDRFAVARRRRRLQSLLTLAEDRRRIPYEIRSEVYHDVSGRQITPRPEGSVSTYRNAAHHFERGANRVSDFYKFQRPERVPICQRRRIRKAVLFALQKIGSGRSGRRRYIKPARWTGKSFIRCK